LNKEKTLADSKKVLWWFKLRRAHDLEGM